MGQAERNKSPRSRVIAEIARDRKANLLPDSQMEEDEKNRAACGGPFLLDQIKKID
jgi:hypothetical protein